MKHRALCLAFCGFLAAQLVPHAAWGQVKTAPPISGIKGKLQSYKGRSLEILTSSGVVRVSVRHPLTTYKQVPSDLSHVTSTSFVGVASVRQADGRELATQIKIFPPELRGAGEGSHRMNTAQKAMTHSRMTNGEVYRPAPSRSRMTNGTVQKGNGTILVVHYQNGAETVAVPANVPVTEVVPGSVHLVPGDTVYAATMKLPNGTLSTNKIFLIAGVRSNGRMQ